MADTEHPTAPPLSPWERPQLPSRFTVEETAARVGHYKWLAMQFFEVLGGWVAIVPEVHLKPRLADHCYQHAFHAELWHKRLPELREVDPESLTTAPNPEMEQLIVGLGHMDSGDDTVQRLAGLYRVLLPHLISAYTFHLHNASDLTDAPTIRALNLCLQDDLEQWREGEMMIQTLIRDRSDIERAAARQTELTTLMLASGGVVGPRTLGPTALDEQA